MLVNLGMIACCGFMVLEALIQVPGFHVYRSSGFAAFGLCFPGKKSIAHHMAKLPDVQPEDGFSVYAHDTRCIPHMQDP